MYNRGKCKCLINIILWSSTLPPWRVPCVHKNWSSVPLVAFLATNINKEGQPQKNICKDTSTMVGIHNWHVWMKHVKYEGMIVNLLFITCKQLISISFENFCILAFKEKHFPWTFKHYRDKLPADSLHIFC